MDRSQEQKENIASLYSRVASTYGQIGPKAFASVGQHLVKHCGIQEGAHVLDVGTGRGANLFPAAEAVGSSGHVTGIDLAEGMIRETGAEIARWHIHNATVLVMDAENLAFADASFDYVLCGFAIFLFPHLEQALSEFSRVLRPGGRLGISVARDLDPLSRWYGEHLTNYHTRYQFPLNAGGGAGSNYPELPRYLTTAGFTHVQTLQEEVDFIYTDAEQWWDAKWTHGTRFSLEHMTPEVLAQFKEEVFARLAQETQGIHETLGIQYILADK